MTENLQTQPPYKPLRRMRDDRILAGVCSGIGRYLNVDPVAVRVAFALIAVLTWGGALLTYPIMWFLMPEEPAPVAPQWPAPTAAAPQPPSG
jgi:phage shock protein PspC (stress-responsive transcriptional regulator)